MDFSPTAGMVREVVSLMFEGGIPVNEFGFWV